MCAEKRAAAFPRSAVDSRGNDAGESDGKAGIII